nr:hypothetical protein Iba_chr10aCG8900 [Ipomoea batatas]
MVKKIKTGNPKEYQTAVVPHCPGRNGERGAVLAAAAAGKNGETKGGRGSSSQSRREKQRSRGAGEVAAARRVAGRSEEEYGSREKHRKAVALLREPPEVAATEDPATLNCCRNFAPLPSPALRVEVFPRRKPPAAGGRRRDWRSLLFPSPSGRRLFW